VKSLSIVGRIGQDPQLKFAQSGGAILTTSVACDYQKKGSSGYERATQWVRVIVFGKRAESLNKVLKKGMRVATSGEFNLNEWTDKQSGEKRVSVEVIANDMEPLFDKQQDSGERSQSRRMEDEYPAAFNGKQGQKPAFDDEDPLPF
jgi:single-strand DNA-binding protein